MNRRQENPTPSERLVMNKSTSKARRAALMALATIVLPFAAVRPLHAQATQTKAPAKHHSKAKGAVVGAAAGAVVGGPVGAVAGAAVGAEVQHHKNKKARKRAAQVKH